MLTVYFLLTTYYLLLTTYRWPPCSLSTYYLLLTTYYLQVAAMLTVSHIWWMAGNLGNTTWPIWMLVICFLAAPFFYNPQAPPDQR